MITVYYEDAVSDVDAIEERDQGLLLDRGVYVGRGSARFTQCQSKVLVSNFSEEYQNINRGAAIAFLEDTEEGSDVITVADFEPHPKIP